jgi:hypothetical protein
LLGCSITSQGKFITMKKWWVVHSVLTCQLMPVTYNLWYKIFSCVKCQIRLLTSHHIFTFFLLSLLLIVQELINYSIVKCKWQTICWYINKKTTQCSKILMSSWLDFRPRDWDNEWTGQKMRWTLPKPHKTETSLFLILGVSISDFVKWV